MKSLRNKIVSLTLAFVMMFGSCFCMEAVPVFAATSPLTMTMVPTSTGFTVKVTSTKSFSSMGATNINISGPNLYHTYISKTDLNKTSMSWNVTLPDTDTRLDTYTFTVKKSGTVIASVSKTNSYVAPVSNLKAVKYGTGLKITWTQASKNASAVYISVKDNKTSTTVYSSSVDRSTTCVVMKNYNHEHSYTVSVKNKNRAGYYSMARNYTVLATP